MGKWLRCILIIPLLLPHWTAAETVERNSLRQLYLRRPQWTDWALPLAALEIDRSLTWTAGHIVKPESCRLAAPLCLGGTLVLLGDSSGTLHAWTPRGGVIRPAMLHDGMNSSAVAAITTYATRKGPTVALVAYENGSFSTAVFYNNAKQAGGIRSAFQATQHSVQQHGPMQGRVQRLEASLTVHKNGVPGVVVEVAAVTEDGNVRLGRLFGDGDGPALEWIDFNSGEEQGRKVIVASIQRAGLYMLTDSGESRWLSHGAAWAAQQQRRRGPPMRCQGSPATQATIKSAQYDAWGHRAVALTEEGTVAIVPGSSRPGVHCSTPISCKMGSSDDHLISSLTALPGFGALAVTATGRLQVLNFTVNKFGPGIPSSHEATAVLDHDMIAIARTVPGVSDRNVYAEWKPWKGAWPLGGSSSKRPKQTPKILLLADRADLDLVGGPFTPGLNNANGIALIQLGPAVVAVFATAFPQNRGATKSRLTRLPLGWVAVLQPFFIAAAVAIAYRRAKSGQNKRAVANFSLDRVAAMPTLGMRRRRPTPSDEDFQGEDEEDDIFNRWKGEMRYDEDDMRYRGGVYLASSKSGGRNEIKKNQRTTDRTERDKDRWRRSMRPLVDRAPVLHRGPEMGQDDHSGRGGELPVSATFVAPSSANAPISKHGEESSVTDVVWE